MYVTLGLCYVCALAPKRPWTEQELKFLNQRFRGMRHPTNYGQLRDCIKYMPTLKSRSLAQIKARVWGLMNKYLHVCCCQALNILSVSTLQT